MEELYMDVAMNLLYDMRLRIEGAVELYENDAAPLRRLALENDFLTAAAAFDTICSALYALRQNVRDLHAAHIKESVRQSRLLK